jgi:sugar diacid utilization regulator
MFYMAFEKEKPAFAEETSFEAVLDKACEKLQEKQVQYSIRRLREMDEQLGSLERELNAFIENPQ